MKETRKRLLGWFLTVAMTLSLTTGLMPVSASAEAKEGTDALHLDKQVTLANDGTYTISLEAYATGEVKIEQEKVPLDIVLVLDQSGSMADPFEYDFEEHYEQITEDCSYWESYSRPLYHKHSDGTYHLLEVTRELNVLNKFRYICSDCDFNNGIEKTWIGTFLQGPAEQIPLFGGWKNKWAKEIYTKETTSTTIDRVSALRNALTDFTAKVEEDAQTNSLDHKIAITGFASETGYGENTEILTVPGENTALDERTTFGVAYKNLGQEQYNNALVNCTDRLVDNSIQALATSGATRADLGMEMAYKILKANQQKGRKQVVILFTDGEPTSGNTFENWVANGAIDYARQIKDMGADVYTVGIFEGADANADMDRTSDANKFMQAVSSNYPDANSMSDYGSKADNGYFMSAANADQLNEVFENISEEVSGSTTVTLDENAVLKDMLADGFVLPTRSTNVTVQTAKYEGNNKWGTPEQYSGTVNVTGNTVSVSGFSYKDNYVIDGQGTLETSGKKLMVTITGVEATDDATTDQLINTNNEAFSGIYESKFDPLPVKTFNAPQTYIPSKTFVLDYGKAAVLDGWNTSEDNAGKSYTTTAPTTLDVEKMGWFNTSTPIKEGTDTYGSVSLNGETLTYTPGTMNWDGYDSFYVFGRWDTNSKPAVDTGDNVWTRVNVVPANNVYYEDDFQNTSDQLEIVYTGDWTTVGDRFDTYTQTVNDNNPYGWVETADITYSDGSAYATGEKGATASFTFTGTGVDVYSHTNMQSGTVYAKLSKEVNGEPVGQQMLIVDGQAVSNGDTGYYQIPTVFFNVPYGTYTVTITVLTAGTEGNYTYYLDGVRVYNPVQEDGLVAAAYAEDGESGAVFSSVRDLLVTKDSFGENGAVYIDKNSTGQTGQTTSEIAEYEKNGPKNEVYLSNGQSIAIQVVTGIQDAHYYVGLKAMNGTANAEVTNGSNKSLLPINSTADRYYEVIPDTNGYIVIKNTGEGLLAVTKLRYTEGGAVQEVDTVGILSYANTFDTLPVVAYAGQESTVETPEIVVEEEDGYKSRVESWLEKLFSGASRWL